MNHISARVFSDSLRKYLRASGYFQKGLAKELGLHPKVLSRKLRGNGDSHLTAEEVQRIISILARWQAITTREEAFGLLELAKLEPDSFTDKDWETPPLSHLTGKDAMLDDVALHFIQRSLPAPLTSFVGREEEVEKLRGLLGRDEVRLVTLVGAGGSGKTRLAQHVANDMADEFAQGVWFVALASVLDAAQVPKSILQALGIQSTLALSAVQSLITYLRHKQLLLILDNFEQVREAAGVVGELLAAAPGLKVLVTSRVVLHLYGESEFKVSPLELPDSSAILDIAKLEQYGAIRLFIERARAVMPDFSLTTENAAAIAQICARVDGLPLTLELAAARVKVLPPELLLARLSAARLTMLTSEAWNLPIRQQALRKTIRWSYDLLTQTERIWFARLGVFNGGWSLEAAEAMMQAFA
ncbi:MAG TPA: NB-ARC domain-containing protein, partial [Ktedonobacteraceae bacterium]|nr:NB-ARC domain-containing protein [Ktedonobacteraceae bacterium]